MCFLFLPNAISRSRKAALRSLWKCAAAPLDPYTTLLNTVGRRAGVDEFQIKKLEAFGDELLSANRSINLTALRSREDIVARHLVDGIGLLPIVDAKRPKTLVDIGSGAGLPGLVLAICRPDLKVTLVEASKKKVAFQEQAIEKLELNNVRSLWVRAEDVGQDQNHREHYDMACARAVAEMRILLELTLPLLRVGGFLLAQKSVESVDKAAEIADAETSLRVLGGSVENIELSWTEEILGHHVPGLTGIPQHERERAVVIVKKVVQTPLKYPRRAGTPKKLPIQ